MVHKIICCENANVPEKDYDGWLLNVLPKSIEKFDPKDISNADETDLFFKCLPNKTLAFKHEKCFGDKHNKERKWCILI